MAPISRHLLENAAVHDVVLGSRLLAAGVSYETIRHAVRTERLFRQYRGVYSLSPSLSDRGRWFAAVAVCGDDAALSHLSAGLHWSVTSIRDHVIEVTVPNHNGRRAPTGIRVHRTIRPQSTRRDRIEVTKLHRTLDDLARRLTHQQLHRALRQAEYHHSLDIFKLSEDARSHPLKALLHTYVAAEGIQANELESAFLTLCVRAGLPRPAGQQWHGPRRVDFIWPEHGLVVELDGRAAHERTLAFQDDRARDRALKLDGLETLRFTWAEVVATPKVVVADLQGFFALRPRVEV
jgi:Protein of unknown function (DUF559)